MLFGIMLFVHVSDRSQSFGIMHGLMDCATCRFPIQVSTSACTPVSQSVVRSGCCVRSHCRRQPAYTGWVCSTFPSSSSTATGSLLGPWSADSLASSPCGLHPSALGGLETPQQDGSQDPCPVGGLQHVRVHAMPALFLPSARVICTL